MTTIRWEPLTESQHSQDNRSGDNSIKSNRTARQEAERQQGDKPNQHNVRWFFFFLFIHFVMILLLTTLFRYFLPLLTTTTTGQQCQVTSQAHCCHATSLDGLWVRQTRWVGGGWSPEVDDNGMPMRAARSSRRRSGGG